MQFDGALVREQGQTFAVVSVKRHVTDSHNQAERAARAFRPAFPGVPIILMSMDGSGRATYFGRPDIVRFLQNVAPHRLPWKRYSAR